jgi:hypothetical protein
MCVCVICNYLHVRVRRRAVYVLFISSIHYCVGACVQGIKPPTFAHPKEPHAQEAGIAMCSPPFNHVRITNNARNAITPPISNYHHKKGQGAVPLASANFLNASNNTSSLLGTKYMKHSAALYASPAKLLTTITNI